MPRIDPPAHSLVLSVDEKSQIQALDRTQPGLPMKPGRAGTMTHVSSAQGRPPCVPDFTGMTEKGWVPNVKIIPL